MLVGDKIVSFSWFTHEQEANSPIRGWQIYLLLVVNPWATPMTTKRRPMSSRKILLFIGTNLASGSLVTHEQGAKIHKQAEFSKKKEK